MTIEPLINHINKFVQLNDEEAELIKQLVKVEHFKKKEYVLKPGKVCRHIYFVANGCLRLYFVNRKDVEQITQFAIENWWLTDQDSFDRELASQYYIQAVEDTDAIVISKELLEELFTRIPKLERYFRIIFQRVYTAWQRRTNFFTTKPTKNVTAILVKVSLDLCSVYLNT